MIENIKVLLLGGTGAIGENLGEVLNKKGYMVYVTSRKYRKNAENVHYIQGNAKDTAFLKKLLNEYKVDIIFDFMLYTVEQFQGRYELLLSSCKQYFFVSSQRVYADVYNSKEELDEHCLRKVDSIDEKWKKDNYGYVKGLEENILFGSIYKNWTIVRMSITFSKNRFQFGPLDNFDVVRAIRSQCSGIPDTLVNTYTTLTYGVDAANLLEMFILHENAYSEVFNISSKEFYTWGEVADIYKEVFGMNYKIISEKEYLIATNTKNMMLDRSLDRKIDTSKFWKVVKGNYTCHSLKEGLREAWNSSDKQIFYNGTGKLDAHTLMDIFTNTNTDINLINPAIQNKYRIMKRRSLDLVKNYLKIRDVYFVTEDHVFWNGKQENKYVHIQRTGSSKGNGCKWYSLMPKFELKEKQKYIFAVKFDSNIETQMRIFAHGYEYNSENIIILPIKQGRNLFKFTFVLNNTARFLAFTATDFEKNSELKIWDMYISKY